mgnify:CR=1 FL=1
MSEKQKVKYRLFALPVSEESMAEAEKKRFSRITAKYVLIYCDSEAANAMQIDRDNFSALTEADKKWLYECNVLLLAEDALRHQEQAAKSLNDMVIALEAALESEKRKGESANE